MSGPDSKAPSSVPTLLCRSSRGARRSLTRRTVLGMAVALAGLAAFGGPGRVGPALAADPAPTAAPAGGEVNVYSARQEHLMKPLLDQFKKETGVGYNLLTGEADQLLARLQSEGENTPADVLITTDVGRLQRAKDAGVLQPVTSPVLTANIPADYRDPAGQWYGLSLRARTIFYARDRVKPSELSTYADLADPKWKGRLCVRSSGSIYNQSMLAAMIATEGAPKAEAWAKGIADNLARKPQGGDRDQIHAVAAGECDIALANTYYYGGLATSDKETDRAAAAKVGVFWPDQQGQGVHVNLSGAGVVKGARHKDAAVKLIEFLSGDEAQRIHAEVNQEYPVKAGVAWSALVTSWGPFKAAPLPVARIGDTYAEAAKIFDRVGWR